jgi:GntR family transcriptional repressor for pyruvate dehydrogenase complex
MSPPDGKPARGPTVSDRAIRAITSLIISGQYTPGAKLPPEKELTALLGVSRNALREAVRALSLIGVLHVRQGDGTYVTTLEPDALLGGTGFAMEFLQGPTALQLYEVRRLLEPAAVALAAARISPESLAEAEAYLLAMDADLAFSDAMVEDDVAFHRTIVRASGNDVLAELIATLSSRTLRLRVWRGRTEPGNVEVTKREHRAIFEALVDRDPETARVAAAVHIANGEAWLRASAAADARPDDAGTVQAAQPADVTA